MDKFQSAFEILFSLAVIDGDLDDNEVKVINAFIDDNIGKSDYDTQASAKSLIDMTFDGRLKQIGRAANHLETVCSAHELNIIFEFALHLIAADGQFTDDEMAAFHALGKRWEIDVKRFVNRRLK